MFKLISLNYTETMNGYSHEVNIGGGGGGFYREISNGISDTGLQS